jgi:hypothetical protein
MQTKAGDAAKKKWVIGDFVVVFMCPYAPGRGGFFNSLVLYHLEVEYFFFVWMFGLSYV